MISREMQIKTPMRYYFILTRYTLGNRTYNNKHG